MIPKTIHYCWFGKKPLPPIALKCINSWRKYLPDYEIKEWNEDNFDVNIIPYTKEAYNAKKYAFVSDYARFWILYNYGGLYFDTDVEIIRSMDGIISRGAFMGCEKYANNKNSTDINIGVNPGLGLATEAKHNLYKEILDLYSTLHFIKKDGSLNLNTVVSYTTDLLCNYGLKNINEIQECAGILIYPKEYFCPIDYTTNKCIITPNTYTIHHFASSWHGKKEKLYKLVSKYFGAKFARYCSNILKKYFK